MTLTALLSIGEVRARVAELSFEDRVKAQEAIERVYYSHQTGTAVPFEKAVSVDSLTNKVRTYLGQSAALEKLWHTPITSTMLQREVERMAGRTRAPDRLRELFTALENDPIVIQECLARPSLADRLTRSFFANDQRIHDGARHDAEMMKARLLSGRLDPSREHPDRSVSKLVMTAVDDPVDAAAAPAAQSARVDEKAGHGIRLARDEFRRTRTRLPARRGEIGPLEENRDSFTVSVVLAEDAGSVEVATFVTRKRTWEDWWRETEGSVAWASVRPVASASFVLPGIPVNEPRMRGSSTPACALDDTWQSREWEPRARFHHSTVWTGSLMVVWGGYVDGVGAVDTGGRYDPATDTWMPVSIAGAPSARNSHAAVWTGSRMIVWGGADQSEYPIAGGQYDPYSDSWAPTSTQNAPFPRSDHTAVWTGDRMIVWGGYHQLWLGDGALYDPVANTWTTMSTVDEPASRTDHVAVWTGTRMIVWGGWGPSGTYRPLGGLYDPVTDTWQTMETAGSPSPRNDLSAVWTGSRMIVWGGATSIQTYTKTGGRYDPVTDAWAPMTTADAPSARAAHKAVWTGSRMIVWGGTEGDASINTGGVYDPASDSWQPTSPVNAPGGRVVHSVVWTGSHMIVWGGICGFCDGNPLLDTGGRYDPVTATWTPTATSVAPISRSSHDAVWTGSLMLVWGGLGSFGYGYLDTGGRYDPALDRWTPISMEGAPSGRMDHRMVWTGTRMIVWGGWGSSSIYPQTGGRYDPLTDTWTPTSALGAPSGRLSHTAIWTGDRMVVWGGWLSAPPNRTNTGGRYDPATDTWTPTSLVGAPTARIYHTAVWTGREMVVWGGGAAPFTDTNTGGLYDPVGDSWRPTSTANAPTGRSGHAAVWMGSSMIIWGGQSQEFGGRYDPETDAWSAISSKGAPGARNFPTAVWTGKEMVVWGGEDFTGSVKTGGRYDPVLDAWASTSAPADLLKRRLHSAVWTGSWMIVWGGMVEQELTDKASLYALGHSEDDDSDGYSECAGDCNDTDPAIHPAAGEICNGIDEDCDGTTDHGPAPLCDDSNPCTSDVCHGASGCSYQPTTGGCDDGDRCTMGDACASGICSGAPVLPKVHCNDHNVCTQDFCDPEVGCMHAPMLCNDHDRNTIDSCDRTRGCVFTPRHSSPPSASITVQEGLN